MRLLITGVCGFVGHAIADGMRAFGEHGLKIVGIDNLSRPGSEVNRLAVKRLGVEFIHGDIRNASDLEQIGDLDWVIDAAANPSVLAGVDGRTSSRQLVEHNLGGTINLLELCKSRSAGLTLLSTSRVYSTERLAAIPVTSVGEAFTPKTPAAIAGLSAAGISETFPTTAPVSLYGATKLASEMLALEYGASFGFPVWVNRCGVLAGSGQFGEPNQGIFSFWIRSWAARQPLRYIGFDGCGLQVRDCLHPRDLLPLLLAQIAAPARQADRIINVSGGTSHAMSLAQLSRWCGDRFGAQAVASDDSARPFDAPWVVLDSAKARALWNWTPSTSLTSILEEIADHAVSHPEWLDLSR